MNPLKQGNDNLVLKCKESNSVEVKGHHYELEFGKAELLNREPCHFQSRATTMPFSN